MSDNVTMRDLVDALKERLDRMDRDILDTVKGSRESLTTIMDLLRTLVEGPLTEAVKRLNEHAERLEVLEKRVDNLH